MFRQEKGRSRRRERAARWRGLSGNDPTWSGPKARIQTWRVGFALLGTGLEVSAHQGFRSPDQCMMRAGAAEEEFWAPLT